MFTIPFEIAMDWWSPDESYVVLGYAADIMFWIDIVLNFQTGFIDKGTLIMSPSRARTHYLRTWFIVDFAANFPLEVFFDGQSKAAAEKRKTLKILKWAKLAKLLRMGRLLRFSKEYIQFAPVLQWTFIYVFVIHACSCIWILLRYDEHFKDAMESTGEPVLDSNLMLYWLGAHSVMLQLCGHAPYDEMNDYPHLGHLLGPLPHEFSFILSLCGVFLTAVIFAHINILLQSRVSAHVQFRTKIDQLKKEMKYHGMPPELMYRVRRFYDYIWLNQKHFGESTLHKDHQLSLSLRREIALVLHHDLLHSTQLFKDCNKDCLAEGKFASIKPPRCARSQAPLRSECVNACFQKLPLF